jgi:hypothetical protein
MPFCRNCGRPVNTTGALCKNCTTQPTNTISKSNKRPRPWTLSNGFNYPLSIAFNLVLVLISVINADVWIDISDFMNVGEFELLIDIALLIIPLIIGIKAVNKERANLFATIGFIGLILWGIYIIVGLFYLFYFIYLLITM